MHKEEAGLVLANGHRDTPLPSGRTGSNLSLSNPYPISVSDGTRAGSSLLAAPAQVCAHLCERSGPHPGGPARPEEAWM